jgi:hypothetical protein
MVSQAEYDRLQSFRDQLDVYIRYVLGEDRPNETQADAGRHIRSLQPELNRTYGALKPMISRYSGTIQMGSRIHGITSHDVIRDAINTLDHPDYPTIAESAVQHLDMTLGRCQSDIGGESLPTDDVPKPTVQPQERATTDWYTRTSVLYWLGRLWQLLRWLLRKPTRAAVTIVVVVITGAVTLFFTVFGADWNVVRTNIESVARFFHS